MLSATMENMLSSFRITIDHFNPFRRKSNLCDLNATKRCFIFFSSQRFSTRDDVKTQELDFLLTEKFQFLFSSMLFLHKMFRCDDLIVVFFVFKIQLVYLNVDKFSFASFVLGHFFLAVNTFIHIRNELC